MANETLKIYKMIQPFFNLRIKSFFYSGLFFLYLVFSFLIVASAIAQPLSQGVRQGNVKTDILVDHKKKDITNTEITLPAANLDPALDKHAVLLKQFSIAKLAEKLQKSVVNISATKIEQPKEEATTVQKPDFGKNFDKEHHFQKFFDQFFDKKETEKLPMIGESALGSGFIVDAEQGYVLTNYHVILDANAIDVIFSDGKKVKAERVGVDRKTDLALLKIDPKIVPLHAVSFADSRSAHIGDWVIAIGNPYGFGGSVTLGIISARNRDIKAGPYDNFIQTDAAINRGNSGGPLFDLDGKALGVNTAIISPNGGSIGIGLAIPSEIVAPIYEQLKTYGKVHRGWLALRIESLSKLIAKRLNVSQDAGVLVTGKMPLSPEDKVDNEAIKPLDVILLYNHQKVKNAHDLAKMIAETPAGTKIPIRLLRDGKEQDVFVQLGLLKEESIALEDEKKGKQNDKDKDSENKSEQKAALFHMGVLQPIDENLRKKYHIADQVKGFVFTKIVKNSEFDKKQIKEGEVLVEINQQSFSSFHDIEQILQKLKAQGRKTALFLIARPDGKLRLVSILIDG